MEGLNFLTQCGKLLRDAGIDFYMSWDYDWITKDIRLAGYAEYYLSECENESTMINEADASIYRQLSEIDTALGTTAGTQLYRCLFWTTRWDIIKTINFEQVTEYEKLREDNYVGFAQVYLKRCDRESQTENIADVQLYTKLVELDTRLGTTATKQLFWCLKYSLRLDLIKVINMAQVNFDYVGEDRFTIYRMCLDRYSRARFTLNRPEAEWRELRTKTEEVFDYLVAEGRRHGWNVDAIVEIPDSNGDEEG